MADEKLRAATLQDPLVAKAAAEKREVEMKMAARMDALKKKKQAEIDKREAEEREKTIAEAVKFAREKEIEDERKAKEAEEAAEAAKEAKANAEKERQKRALNRAANAQGAASHAHAANEHAAAHNAKSHSSRNLLVPPPSKLSGHWVMDANGISRYYTNDANEAHRMNKAHGARHDQSFEAGYGAQHKTIKENKKDSTKQMLKEELEAMAANVDEEREEQPGEENE